MVLFPDSCSVPFTKRLTPVAYDGFERAVFYDVSPLYGRILLEQGTRLMHEEVVIVSVNSKQSILTTTTQKGHATRRRRKEAALRHYQFQCSNSVTRPTPSVVAGGRKARGRPQESLQDFAGVGDVYRIKLIDAGCRGYCQD